LKKRNCPAPGSSEAGQAKFEADTKNLQPAFQFTSSNRRAGRASVGAWSRNAAGFFRSRIFLDAALPWADAAFQSSTMGRMAQ
jgi:hypothetical protein